MDVAGVLDGKRICVCVGAGGVGKTTTSAVIALGMAARGARVCVVTIDPARRLANAIGLDSLPPEPVRVEPERWEVAGLALQGELWAMMLDPKRTFDELIDAVAPTPQRAEEVRANRIYRELSTAVSGSQEFTAVAKLHDLAASGRFDLLVLDTPPSRNAVDFLEAPARLTSFLDGRALSAFRRPTGLGVRLLGVGAGPLLGAVRRITGIDLVGDITGFFALLGGMTDQFSARASAVQALLRSEEAAFLLITSAQREPIDEGIWFRRTLRGTGLPFAGVVVNRFHHDLGDGETSGDADALDRALRELLGGDSALVARIVANRRDYHQLAVRDAENVARLARELGDEPLLLVPHLDDEIHDAAGLLRVHAYLFGTDAERAALIEDAVA